MQAREQTHGNQWKKGLLEVNTTNVLQLKFGDIRSASVSMKKERSMDPYTLIHLSNDIMSLIK